MQGQGKLVSQKRKHGGRRYVLGEIMGSWKLPRIGAAFLKKQVVPCPLMHTNLQSAHGVNFTMH